MPRVDAFAETFLVLRGILQRHGARLMVTTDTPTEFTLSSPTMKDRSGRPLFAACAVIKKNYVSYHFMPIYMNPALVETLSPALRKRMQGKGCFNFTRIDAPEAKELAALTKTGLASFKNLKLPWAD